MTSVDNLGVFCVPTVLEIGFVLTGRVPMDHSDRKSAGVLHSP